MTDTEVSSAPPQPRTVASWAIAVAVLAAVGLVASLVSQPVLATLPLCLAFACAIRLAEHLLSYRRCRIRLEGAQLVIQNRWGWRDVRDLADLWTVEWHKDRPRNSIVLNFSDETDNLRLPATGFDPDSLIGFAQHLHRQFVEVRGGVSRVVWAPPDPPI